MPEIVVVPSAGVEMTPAEAVGEECRALVRATLRDIGELGPEYRVWRACQEVRGRIAGGGDDAARAANRAGFLMGLLDSMPAADVARGLEGLFFGPGGGPLDAVGAFLPGQPCRTETGESCPPDAARRLLVGQGLEEALRRWKAERLARSAPVDLSRPPSPPAALVDGVLERGRLAVVGGPWKTLKTHVLIDLAVSLATGTKFLGRWAVSPPRRVLVLYAEEVPSALDPEESHRAFHGTVERIRLARGVNPPGSDRLRAYCEAPSPADVPAWLAARLSDFPADLVVLDPLTRLVPPEDARDVYAMSGRLNALERACKAAGATLLVAHHTTSGVAREGRRREGRRRARLADLAFAGIKEYAGQWLLLARRGEYSEARPGHHELSLSVGRASGNTATYPVTVREGASHDGWDVTVREPGEADEGAAAPEAGGRKGRPGRQKKRAGSGRVPSKQRVREALVQAVPAVGGTIGAAALWGRVRDKVSGERFYNEALPALQADGVLAVEGKKRSQMVTRLK